MVEWSRRVVAPGLSGRLFLPGGGRPVNTNAATTNAIKASLLRKRNMDNQVACKCGEIHFSPNAVSNLCTGAQEPGIAGRYLPKTNVPVFGNPNEKSGVFFLNGFRVFFMGGISRLLHGGNGESEADYSRAEVSFTPAEEVRRRRGNGSSSPRPTGWRR